MSAIAPNEDHFKPIILKFKKLFIIEIVKKKSIIFVYVVVIFPITHVEENPPGEKFFNIDIFRKNASKCKINSCLICL